VTAKIIDGKVIAEQVRGEVANEVRQMVAQGLPRPGLATVLVGDNPASVSYVRSKQKACAELGIESFGHNLPASTSQQELEDLLGKLNADLRVNGILVSCPCLPGLMRNAPSV